MAVRLQDYLLRRVRELCKLPHETEWAEFKRNFSNPDDIGEYISALSNSAALAGKQHGYVLWGIEDQTHEVVGTGFAPSRAKKGSEDLTGWLARLLNPQIEFMFHELELKGLRVVLLEIPRAVLHPVRFKSEEFIRIGSYTKKLKDFPERERELWRILGTTPFENLVALKDVAADSVLHLLDYPAYFKLLNLPLPSGKMGVLEALAADRLIMASEAGNWDITNL